MDQKQCKTCQQTFCVTDDDKAFYAKIRVPEPTLCPDCRQQRRLAFRNERNLYKRKCDSSGKNIISNYSSDKPYKVYNHDEWWGDSWDPLSYGREFDFSKPFFEQFQELLLKVPRLYLYNPHSENCEYTNHTYFNKNCYLIFNSAYCEDVYYSSNLMLKTKDCVDCMTVEKGELLYECSFAKDCYNGIYLIHCGNCRDSAFLYDCKGCANCFMCTNLRNKEFYIENQPYSPEEYEKKKTGYSDFEKAKEQFEKMVQNQAIHKDLHVEKSENCKGDYVFNSKNVFAAFYADKCEDIAYCYDALENKDSYDTYESSIKVELQYECYACNESSSLKFCVLSHFSHNLQYCDYCFHCQDCFGCTGLKRKKYCILNKQYSEEEYKKLLPQMIDHMIQTGEYGEFFPIKLSPFCYNETIAQEYYPLTKEEAESKGYQWKNDIQVSSTTADALVCGICNKKYKTIKQETEFYEKMHLPTPKKCWQCRYKERIKFKNPRKLWWQNCKKCKEQILTTYSPDRPETVYCEKCYLEAVY